MGRIKRPTLEQPSLFDARPKVVTPPLTKVTEFTLAPPAERTTIGRACPTCGSMGSIMSVTSPFVDGAPSTNVFELVTTFECEEGHRWETRKERRDVCAHGRTTDCACTPCGRSWEDVAEATAAKAKDGTSEELIRRGKVSRRIRP